MKSPVLSLAVALVTCLLAGCGGGNGLHHTATPPTAPASASAAAPVPSGPDTTGPTVVFTRPVHGSTEVAAGSHVTVTFSEEVDPSSVSPATFSVAGVTGTIAAVGARVRLTPSIALTPLQTYAGVVRGGPGGVTDLVGNPLQSNINFTFTTAADLACGGVVRCVGPGKAYSTIQDAVDAAGAGDTVTVSNGSYDGFVVSSGGDRGRRLTIRAEGSDVVLAGPNERGEGITLDDVSDVSIVGFQVVGMPGFGFATHGAEADVPMRRLEIRNNIVTGSGSSNVYLSQVAYSTITGNIASGSVASHGFYLANAGADRSSIRGNVAHDNAVNGFHFNGDSSIGGDGLQTALEVEGNISYRNVANGMNMDGVQDSDFRNNLVFSNGRNGLRFYGEDAAAGPARLRIVNNTIDVGAGTGWAIKLTRDQGGHVIFNNILLSAGGGGSLAVANASFTSDYNRMTGRLSLDGDSSSIGLPAWQAAGHDRASLEASAADQFVNAAGGDYLLKAGASAVDRGVSALAGVAAPPKDVRGAARPGGAAHDLGAYEQF